MKAAETPAPNRGLLRIRPETPERKCYNGRERRMVYSDDEDTDLCLSIVRLFMHPFPFLSTSYSLAQGKTLSPTEVYTSPYTSVPTNSIIVRSYLDTPPR